MPVMLALSVAPLLAALSCTRTPAPPDNVLLIVLDTTRADRLQPYGAKRKTSPAIQELADRGAVFEHAYSTANWTSPSVASLMTSKTPRDHGIANWAQPLDPDHTTLAEVLSERGYHTMAVVSHLVFEPELRFDQGFDHYDRSILDANNPHTATTADQVTDLALAALDDWKRDTPFFLWTHYFDPHADYVPHEAPAAFGDKTTDLYDGEIRHTDEQVGRLLEGLDERGLTDRTWVILIADHGEEFGDHGGQHHRARLYDELVHVPLIVAGPGISPQRVEPAVQNIDVAPTLLTLLGLEPPREFDGQAIPRVDGAFTPTPRSMFLECRLHGDLRGMVRWPYKVIRDLVAGPLWVFDLEQDPGEHTNLARRYGPLRDDLNAELEAYFAQETYLAPSRELPSDEVRRLELLGYIDEADAP